MGLGFRGLGVLGFAALEECVLVWGLQCYYGLGRVSKVKRLTIAGVKLG